jgi:hypothetical protein
MDLDELTTEELRQRAFDKARDTHDVGFFWDVVKHLRASGSIAAEDASSGNLTGSVTEAVEVVRELMGKDLGYDEPLLRAKYLTYLES